MNSGHARSKDDCSHTVFGSGERAFEGAGVGTALPRIDECWLTIWRLATKSLVQGGSIAVYIGCASIDGMNSRSACGICTAYVASAMDQECVEIPGLILLG